MVTRQLYKIYSVNYQEQFVVAERFIRTIRNKIYEHRTSLSKNVYTDKLVDIVNE